MSSSKALQEPLRKLLAPATATALAKHLGLHTVEDLLSHYPRRYVEPGRPAEADALPVGEFVSVFARVRHLSLGGASPAVLKVTVNDGHADLMLTFFGKSQGRLEWRVRELQPDVEGVFTGTVSEFRGVRQLTHPNYHLVGKGDIDNEAQARYRASQLVPIYPATAKVQTWQIQKAVAQVLDPLIEAQVPDPIPAQVRADRGLMSRFAALQAIHQPESVDAWHAARDRLRYEEAFVLQAALAQRRVTTAHFPATARPLKPNGLLDRFDASLPFSLTAEQRKVGEELARDLTLAAPMQRLLQGEVGSGKTIVALRAMLQVIDAGGQAALLAPTEVLAAQHARTLETLLGDLAHRGDLFESTPTATAIALLTGSLPAAARREALRAAETGTAGIVVGTHALLSEGVAFADLGLVVVDEQHRFGVEQRDALRIKGAVAPHLLVMTATPIPRTVAMTVFGDLAISTIAELPPGRAGTVTHVVPATNARWLARTWQRVREEVDCGHRVYVVCPRIHSDSKVELTSLGGPETDGAHLAEPALAGSASGRHGAARPAAAALASVLEVAQRLRATPELSGLCIEVMHGQLPSAEKERVMARFASGECQILVSTTVIEVGVDVPEATVMVVFDAEWFGLAQLHQLRGRVGRGAAPGLCLLISAAPPGSPGAARVAALAATSDGFQLAQTDLELRREGDVMGAAQSGRGSLNFLRVTRDVQVITEARADASAIVEPDPELLDHPELAAAIRAQLAPDQEEFLTKA